TMARWNGGGGNTIKLRHNASYLTAYLHLSRFEKGVREGTRVRQGQIIGYVGSTGASTGPHLHFEFHHNGRVLDPLKQSFPAPSPFLTPSWPVSRPMLRLSLALCPRGASWR
ncbi:MAG: M23 family metallopeptidase, partial [Calothrix sp. SM1_5_4]|nr:M23 family metallopeptidase [Calothrix sp. SM1_5_4]